MAKRSEVLSFIGDCLSAGKCNVVSDKKQDEWIGKLSGLPPEAFPAILEGLKELKRRPKSFPLACLRIYKELPVIDLREEVKTTGWRATYDDIRGVVARLLVRLGV